MTNTAWLVAYDIAEPRRLGRIGRLSARHAVRVQQSLYLHLSGDAAFDAFWLLLAAEIEPREDDIRAWRLTENTAVWVMGRSPLPPGAALCVNGNAQRLLQGAASNDTMGREPDCVGSMEAMSTRRVRGCARRTLAQS